MNNKSFSKLCFPYRINCDKLYNHVNFCMTILPFKLLTIFIYFLKDGYWWYISYDIRVHNYTFIKCPISPFVFLRVNLWNCICHYLNLTDLLNVLKVDVMFMSRYDKICPQTFKFKIFVQYSEKNCINSKSMNLKLNICR